jgi:hypothetical protein
MRIVLYYLCKKKIAKNIKFFGKLTNIEDESIVGQASWRCHLGTALREPESRLCLLLSHVLVSDGDPPEGRLLLLRPHLQVELGLTHTPHCVIDSPAYREDAIIIVCVLKVYQTSRGWLKCEEAVSCTIWG